MAPRRTRSIVPRLAALTGAAAALYHLKGESPAYAVKGAWEGEPTSLKDGLSHVFSGLEPNVTLPVIAFQRKGLGVSAEKGHLVASYHKQLDNDTSLHLSANEKNAWTGSIYGKDTKLSVKGKGTDIDSVAWKASKESTVDELGDLFVEFTSDKEYNLTLSNKHLAKVSGTELGTVLRATNDGVTGHLKASHKLPGGAKLTYGVKNPVGDYEFAGLKHTAELSAPVAGGSASLLAVKEGEAEALYKAAYEKGIHGGKAKISVSLEDDNLTPDASYAHFLPIEHLLENYREKPEIPPDHKKREGFPPYEEPGPKVVGKPTGGADWQVGINEFGLYGKVHAEVEVKDGLVTEYEARAKMPVGPFAEKEEKSASFKNLIRLSSDLGYAELRAQNGAAPRLRVGYEFKA